MNAKDKVSCWKLQYICSTEQQTSQLVVTVVTCVIAVMQYTQLPEQFTYSTSSLLTHLSVQ